MAGKTKIGLLGGTFNPIHNSHIHLARQYTQQLSLDKIIIVPTFTPPHKKVENLASGEDRYNMCRLATRDLPLFHVTRFELEQQGKSYTYKTLRHILGEYPGSELFLIVGADMFLTIQDWRHPAEIFKMATICGGQREAGEQAMLEAHRQVLEAGGARCAVISLEAKPLSSTQVREMIATGRNPEGLLHPDVWSYIVERGLYSHPGSARSLQ
ncbi:MAG: nicotinate-nucleotide adenylyltransferase [Oscillospiraceae bacterium]|nr:nicotinate-nucleotide adenylyltransferase [Oscillospiraceae bacterium]